MKYYRVSGVTIVERIYGRKPVGWYLTADEAKRKHIATLKARARLLREQIKEAEGIKVRKR